MMCVWCDTPSAKYSATEVNNLKYLIELQAANNTAYFTQVTEKMWAEKEPADYPFSLYLNGKSFSIAVSSEAEGKGIIVVALYKSVDDMHFIDSKVFNLANSGKTKGKFTEEGFVKAFWLEDFSTLSPLSETVIYNE